MLSLYPDIDPYKTHRLQREKLSSGQVHDIYIEECGNPEGIPIVFLHGGPGSGCRPQHRRYFDPKKYKIILFDQRGCGRSTPLGELENNTTDFLISDMEAIRQHLNITNWIIFGGSWGATLALCYAQQHPKNILSMILRGTFLARSQDIDWVYKEGASRFFPDAWQVVTENLPSDTNILEYYLEQLSDSDLQTAQSAAKNLNGWEATIVTLRDHHFEPEGELHPNALAHSKIQLHYALNRCFIEDKPILDNLADLKHIPTQMIHGRYDMVCPVNQSWALKQAWPEIKLTILPLAGHAGAEPAMIHALIEATNQLVEQS